MSAATDFFEGKIIDHMLRGQAYTPPATLYLALYTTATTDAGGGTEVVGGSYARQACALDAASGTGGGTANSALETFTNMPACTVSHWALLDASTSGNMLIQGAVNVSKVFSGGEDATVAIGALDITVA